MCAVVRVKIRKTKYRKYILPSFAVADIVLRYMIERGFNGKASLLVIVVDYYCFVLFLSQYLGRLKSCSMSIHFPRV